MKVHELIELLGSFEPNDEVFTIDTCECHTRFQPLMAAGVGKRRVRRACGQPPPPSRTQSHTNIRRAHRHRGEDPRRGDHQPRLGRPLLPSRGERRNENQDERGIQPGRNTFWQDPRPRRSLPQTKREIAARLPEMAPTCNKHNCSG